MFTQHIFTMCDVTILLECFKFFNKYNSELSLFINIHPEIKNKDKNQCLLLFGAYIGNISLLMRAKEIKLLRLGEKGHTRFSRTLCGMAASGGQLDTLKWLISNGCAWTRLNFKEIYYNAAKYGHKNIIIWAIANDNEHKYWLSHYDIKEFAIEGGQLELLIWLCRNIPPDINIIKSHIWNYALKIGQLEILKWIYNGNDGIDLDMKCIGNGFIGIGSFTVIAEHGYLEILEWLFTIIKCDDGIIGKMCISAAMSGQLKVLELLHNKNMISTIIINNTDICTFAAKNGHLEVLMWLQDKGFAWDELTCEMAAINGHLQILMLLHDHNCPINPQNCYDAIIDEIINYQDTLIESDDYDDDKYENKEEAFDDKDGFKKDNDSIMTIDMSKYKEIIEWLLKNFPINIDPSQNELFEDIDMEDTINLI